MRFYKFFSITALLWLIFCASFTTALAKGEWVKVRSKNFNLIGDAPEKDMRAVAVSLEKFRDAFQQFFININFESQLPLNIVVFESDQQLHKFTTVKENAVKKDLKSVYFQSEELGHYLAFSVENRKTKESLAPVLHEYIHFLLNENFGRSYIQPWFNEGLAEYYDAIHIEDGGEATFGSVKNEHLLTLQQNKLIPLEVFLEMDYYSLQRQGNHGTGLFYAQAWILMHFLMRSENSVRLEQFNKFTQLVLSGKRQIYAFEEAFQTNYQAVESELKKYIEQKKFNTDVSNGKNKLAAHPEIQSSPALDAEAKTALGALLYQSNSLPEAAVLLEDAAKFDRDASSAYSLLGLVKFKQKKTIEAEKLLEKAIALDDKNYLAHYRYAYVLSREGMTDYGFASNYTAERANRIRAALKKAIAINPNFPESYNLYAFLSYVRNEELDLAIEYIERALKVASGNQRYQMRLAELSSLKKDFGKARHYARKVFETTPDERLRVYAKNAIYVFDTYESQLESLKNPWRKRLHEVTDQPLSDEESARLNWLAMLQAINQNLRRLKHNEKRVLGYLTRIDCGADGIKYLIKTEGQTLTLKSDDFHSLLLSSYRADVSGWQVGCGSIKQDVFAVIGYRPLTEENTKTAGEILSIEFVPENFKLQN